MWKGIFSNRKFEKTVHNVQKYHKCESCGKTFSQSGSLKVRINSVHKVIIRDKKITNVTFVESLVLPKHFTLCLYFHISFKKGCVYRTKKRYPQQINKFGLNNDTPNRCLTGYDMDLSSDSAMKVAILKNHC